MASEQVTRVADVEHGVNVTHLHAPFACTRAHLAASPARTTRYRNSIMSYQMSKDACRLHTPLYSPPPFSTSAQATQTQISPSHTFVQ